MKNKVIKNKFQAKLMQASFSAELSTVATPTWRRDGAFRVYQNKLYQIYNTTKKTLHHLKLCSSKYDRFGRRCSGCQKFADFREALQ
jgi:hypothetical protein